MIQLGRKGISCALAWILCAALYFWTANGVGINDADRRNAWHHYEYLVDGFLNGHTYLSLAPAPEMLALPDPYDPQLNLPYRLWDASLYQGKYYLYYGPTPALLLMLPWKIIAGQPLPQRLATAVFASAGLAALVLLLAAVQRTYLSRLSPTGLFLAVLFVGHVTWLPVILRRPAFWELPITAAAALFWWSLYFLWRYQAQAQRRWALAAGIALAFALGARPTYLFTAAFLGMLFALPPGRRVNLPDLTRRLLPAAIPLAVGIIGLLAYNYARFGAVFEFGQRYQVWGMDERNVPHFSLNYVPFNVWLYFFSVPEFSPYFPFVRTVWPTSPPANYIATEEIHGLLFALPALLLGIVAWLRMGKFLEAGPRRSLIILLTAATGASALATGVLCCFAGACSRYIVELLAGWSVVAGIGFMAVFDKATSPFPQRAGRLLAGIAVIWSGIYVWLASFEFRVFARRTNPGFYSLVAHTLNYPSHWAAQRAGQIFGPVVLEVRLSPIHPTGSVVLLAAGRPGMMNQLVLERPTATTVRLRLQINDITVIETPVFSGQGSTLRVECHAPWLYPPVAHPYWGNFSDESERQERQSLFMLTINGVQYTRATARSFEAIRFDALRFDPAVQKKDLNPDACAWVEHWSRLDAPAGLH